MPTTPAATLTKREHIAALLAQGILSNPNPGMQSKCVAPGERVSADVVALVAVEYADRLLQELGKNG
jgi:hypothetical protein